MIRVHPCPSVVSGFQLPVSGSLNGAQNARARIALADCQRREPPRRRRSVNCIVPDKAANPVHLRNFRPPRPLLEAQHLPALIQKPQLRIGDEMIAGSRRAGVCRGIHAGPNCCLTRPRTHGPVWPRCATLSQTQSCSVKPRFGRISVRPQLPNWHKMSLEIAISLILGELPAPLAEAVGQALSINKDPEILQIHRFCILRVSNIPNMRFFWERRLIGCETHERESFFKARIFFLDQSIAALTQDDLWHGCWTVDEKPKSFLIDASRKVFCTGPFP